MTVTSDTLEHLLSEPPEHSDARARAALTQALAGFGERVVIYGAGQLGRRVLSVCRQLNLQILGFADANPALEGVAVDSVSVFNPEDAASRYGGSALFIVAVWHPARSHGMHHILTRLTALGCTAVPFVTLFWHAPDSCLPYYLWDLPGKLLADADQVRLTYQLFEEDPESQQQFVRQVSLRLTADFAQLAPPANEPQYFPKDLFRADAAECFVDCGAFDGDSIEQFVAWANGAPSRIHAFEADPENFRKLQQFLAAHPLTDRCKAWDRAVGERDETVYFDATGAANAGLAAAGKLAVRAVRLDSALAGEPVSFIKMDIEGAEPGALRGAAELIRVHRPVLAICVYHQQDHLWTVPLLMHSILGTSLMSLRSYCLDGLDTVCYAVPSHRRLPVRGGTRNP